MVIKFKFPPNELDKFLDLKLWNNEGVFMRTATEDFKITF